MEKELTLEQSKVPTLFQMVGVGLTALFLIFVISTILEAINRAVDIDITSFANLIRAFAAVIAMVALISIWVRSKKSGYVLKGDAITLQKSGFGGARRMKIFNYKDISSLKLEQSFLGSKFDYGDVIISMDHTANNEIIRLTHLENPQKYLDFLHQKTLKK